MEKPELNSVAHALISHIVMTPRLSENLKTLHSLALYESGDALLGPEEKAALLATMDLAHRLDNLTEDDRIRLTELM